MRLPKQNKIMRNKILSFLIIPALLIISLNSGCKYDSVLPETVPPGDTIYFSLDILPIFNDGCNFSGCHNFGGTPPDLTPNNAYGELTTGGYINLDTPDQSELYKWVNGEGSIPMPISGTDPVTASKILRWIEQGAQNN